MSAGEESRKAAEEIGEAVEEGLGKFGDAWDAARGKHNDPPPEESDGGDGGNTTNITVNNN